MTAVRHYRNRGLLMLILERYESMGQVPRWRITCYYSSDNVRDGFQVIRWLTFWKAMRKYVKLWLFPASVEGRRHRNPRKRRPPSGEGKSSPSKCL